MMRRLFFFVLFFTLLGCSCFANTPWRNHAWYVSENHPLREIEASVKPIIEGDLHAYTKISVKDEDTEGVVFQKLLLLESYERTAEFQLSQKKNSENIVLLTAIKTYLCEQTKNAIALFPESSVLAVLHVKKWIHMDYYNISAISPLLPFFQDCERVPAIPRVLWEYYRHFTEEKNAPDILLPVNINNLGLDAQRKTLSKEEVQTYFKCLTVYWAKKLSTETSGAAVMLDAEKDIEKYKDNYSESKAMYAWRNTLITLHARYTRLHSIPKPTEGINMEPQTMEQLESKRERLREERYRKALISIDELTKKTHSIAEIRGILKVLVTSREMLTSNNVPNYDKIFKALGEDEADLVNALYIGDTLQNFRLAKPHVEKVYKRSPTDIRAIALLAEYELSGLHPNLEGGKKLLSEGEKVDPNDAGIIKIRNFIQKYQEVKAAHEASKNDELQKKK